MMFSPSDLQEFTALPPIVSDDDTTLILMSMPSVDSHRENFYFADASNRFWPLMSAICHMPAQTREQCMQLLKTNHIAMWSVIKSCLRYESREDTMEDIVLNDMEGFLARYPKIDRILCVGHDTLRLLQEADPAAALISAYVPSPSAADLWYDSDEKLMPEYAKALGVIR